ncbi:DNA polymerase I [Phytomonospora endophytica]|uniref:DNA polymerase I n=1 Tax=Phytomonospora endophytica TaxID=714109 RepID=A0A841FL63_9ACTN|nr:DNA polymerase I [Phytomonospora endophytica]MBB6035663.1 DNA polymerase-1 [Phytomonospora endophytica]GIG69660.1 DNA polymerase I [Phytomonospora endophytica]
MTNSKPRLLLLDGHSLAYRAFHALPEENFATSTGQTTNAVYGFTSMLINLLRDEKPSHVAVAFDVSRVSFRTAMYAEYKDGRSATPASFKGQVELIGDVLESMGITALRKEGFEADDIIATLSTQATAAGFTTLICSGDRDALQLVDADVTLLYPKKGVSDLARMTPPAVEEKYGVTPERYRDLAALVGEKSDNLPGVPGVGPKTAAKWITTYGSLDGIVAEVDAIKGKAGENLRAHLGDVLRNSQVNRLLTDVELEAGPAELEWRGWDRSEVSELFDSLEFRVLGDRIAQTLGDKAVGEMAERAAAEPVEQITGTVLASGEVAAWLDANTAPGQRAALAVTGTFGRGTGDLTAMAVASGEEAAWWDPAALEPKDEQAVAAWLADPERPKIVHDAKPVLLASAARGWPFGGLAADTALAAYLVRPDRRNYGLDELSQRYLRRELDAATEESAQPTLDAMLDEGPADAAEQALIRRARAVLDLAEVLDTELERTNGTRLLAEIELPLVTVLAEMERAGIAADTAYLDELDSRFAADARNSEQAAIDVIGEQFSLRSPKQLQAILFDKLGLPKTKRTKTGYTTDAEALRQLHIKTEHPVLLHLLRYREVDKLKTTVAGLLAAVADDGRIHTTFQQTVAATGRLSSTDPNLQNIPIRTDEGRLIRRAFVVGAGHQELMTADYSQIEMRIMAHLSADEGLIGAFASGEDLHTTVASRVFEVAPADVDAEMRRKIKAMSYGLAYGLSSYGLSQQLGISAEEARGLMEEYFERFGGVRDYLRSVVEVARREGYTETIFGRRRYLPELTSDNRQLREMAERAALNAPIQGSAADVMKIAMLAVDRAIGEAGLRSRVLLQVHDELVLEVAPGERDRLEALVRAEMAAACELSVPLDVSVGVGADWDSAAH